MIANINLILGGGLIIYGVYTWIMRKTSPARFKKMTHLIEKHGAKMGTNIHFVGHTVMPIVAGVLLIVAYLRGV